MILLQGASSGSSTGTRLFSVESYTVTLILAIFLVFLVPGTRGPGRRGLPMQGILPLARAGEFRETLFTAVGKTPSGILQQRLGAHREIQVLGIGTNRLGNHDADQIASVVEDRTAAVAGADGRGNLQKTDFRFTPRDHSVAQRELEAFRMSDDKNRFAFYGRGNGLNKLGVPGLPRYPEQGEIEALVTGDHIRSGPHARGHGHQGARVFAVAPVFAVHHVMRGGEKISIGVGAQKDTRAQAERRRFLIAKPLAPPRINPAH